MGLVTDSTQLIKNSPLSQEVCVIKWGGGGGGVIQSHVRWPIQYSISKYVPLIVAIILQLKTRILIEYSTQYLKIVQLPSLIRTPWSERVIAILKCKLKLIKLYIFTDLYCNLNHFFQISILEIVELCISGEKALYSLWFAYSNAFSWLCTQTVCEKCSI